MHIDLTQYTKNKFLWPALAIALTLAAPPSVAAQGNDSGGYQGPGISTPGENVGTRGGRQVDLRFFAGVAGVLDGTLQPLQTDEKGNIVTIRNLYGIEATAGAYGVHNFKRSQLGLDYHGSYRRYVDTSLFNGSDQSLALGYKYQSNRRVVLDLHESAGTISIGNSGLASSATRDPLSGVTPGMFFLDSRTTYLQSTAALTWLQSARTSFTISGAGFLQNRKAAAGLSNSWGYDLTGGVNRRVSRSNSIGANFTHSHFESPQFQTVSDSNAYHGTYASSFARAWTFSVQAGVVVSEVLSPFNYALDPYFAALFGQKTITGIAYIRTAYPSGAATLVRQFQRASLSFNYVRGVNSGNGLTSTARQESASASIYYTGLRRVSLSASGGYNSLSALGQNTGRFSIYTGGGAMSYNLGHATYLNLRYDYRDQQIDISGYSRTGSRASVGLSFSPGNIPLSMW